MSSSQTGLQYYSINLALTREFLKWVYTHRLVDGQEFQHLWDNKPDTEGFRFGGRNGTQFSTLQNIESFNGAFDNLLTKFNIHKEHKHSLLYLIMFLGRDTEQQSIENNWNNHLLDYARFITDLISDSLAHMEAMRKNPLYEEIYDEYTTETFFAKHEVVVSMPYEELLEYVPLAKQADDIVKYVRIPIYDQELHIPEDLIVSIQSNKGRILTSRSGAQVKNVELPSNLKRETFKFLVDHMLGQHEKHNTAFYQEIIKDNTILSDLANELEKANKKHVISNVVSLAKVGTILTDYLLKHKLFSSKRSISTFLFEYFALFKAIILKKQPLVFPTNYDELIPFYRSLGVDGEKLRNQMKDVGEI